jgi:ABC-type antimicrobial peptide transport system permease subunit
MAEHVDRTLATPRFRTALVASFAGVALLLALVGIYGVIAYSVTQRRREMAIRRSVGARSGSLLRLVIGQGVRLALLGIALGAAGSLALTHLLRRFLFGVSAADPAVFATVPVLVLAIAAAASIVPAARAARIDPMRVLRED